ncbi:TlpA family protein disulfide reductase [Chryseobacterium salivictor]|uniref:Thioredoxin n=1 Tax=Chryseobacterium salivictor TaxID=2547600 RepID=A0A4P6ZFP9_9FLAO|nr:TlpA disulfide reductase family protein [Chryseobacterium salivictor]QBO58388.1 Thioredoxin [Chryseobacterium salivictor]
MKNKFCREILSLTFMTLLFVQIPAQLKALKIGDSIPEEVWTTPLQLVNSPQKTLQLSKDREKLILLDFWATWCGSCLKNFPKMEELEKQFGGRIKIIPVTSESSAVLDKFFSTANGKRYSKTASVKEDKTFHQLFPHTAVPYIAWIKNGKLINTTDAEQVTEQTVAEILNDKNSSLQTVIQVDRSRPFMLSENFDLEKQTALRNYTFLSKGRIRSAAAGSVFRRKDQVVYGRLFSNVVLMFIYRGIAAEIFSQNGEQFSDKRISNFVKFPSEITFDPSKETTVPDARYYTFEYIDTVANADSLYNNMLSALNRSTDYTASTEQQKVKCLVIRQNTTKMKKQQRSDTGLSMQNLVSLLNADNNITSLPIIDESKFVGNTGIEKEDIRDLNSLKSAFAKHHLQVTEEERNLMMFVIKDK